MTEAEWLACANPTPMLEFLRGKASDRKFRLFAVGCCRRIWHLMPDERSRNAVEAAEQFADGRLNDEAFFAAFEAFRSAANASDEITSMTAIYSSNAACSCARWRFADEHHTRWEPGEALSDAQATAKLAARVYYPDTGEEHSAQATLVLDVFGNPSRPSPPLPPAILAWNDGTVRRIAEGIYQDRKMPEGTLDTARLLILADALLDAGCDDEALMVHFRSEGPHVRGCWAVDLILEKQ